MSINSALAAGASGLMANSSALAAIADNIANVNTTGYKRVDTTFAPNYQVNGGGEAQYASSGVQGNSALDISTPGLLEQSSTATDVAIDGAGFFVVREDPSGVGTTDAIFLTRSGSFSANSTGHLVNDAGQYLYAWPLDGTTTLDPSSLDQLEAVNLSSISGIAQATSNIAINANLNASQTVNAAVVAGTYDPTASANNMASGAITPDVQYSVDVFDSQGGLRTVTLSLLRAVEPNEWHAEIHIEPASDIEVGAPLVDGQISTGMLKFDTNGEIDTTTPLVTAGGTALPLSVSIGTSSNAAAPAAGAVEWAYATGVGAQTLAFDFGTAGTTGGLRQFDSPSVLDSTSVDGAIFGELAGVEISADGIITARFTNGLVEDIYQIPVATVNNPDGLAAVGSGAYQVTDASGNFTLMEPGSGGSGAIQSYALEASNVDIASEFAELIIIQRAYSASSRIITTADEMLTEALQMKR